MMTDLRNLVGVRAEEPSPPVTVGSRDGGLKSKESLNKLRMRALCEPVGLMF